MPDILLLRLDAPLMSFGAPMIDNYGVIQSYPGRSQLTGMIANALGFHHRDTGLLQGLQDRIRFAARCDRPGTRIRDYQTVDLGQEFMLDKNAWTTRGKPDSREGDAKNARGTHIRYRDYWADSVFTVAICLDPPDPIPDIHMIADAFAKPVRPLFIGRKCCLPAGSLLLGVTIADSPVESLRMLPRISSNRANTAPATSLSAWWDDDSVSERALGEAIPVTDERDWVNQIHVGRRLVCHGMISPPEATHDT